MMLPLDKAGTMVPDLIEPYFRHNGKKFGDDQP
jgi:hypothetical protein